MTTSAATSPPVGSADGREPVVLHGIGVAPGIVIARALVFDYQEVPFFRIPLLRQEVKPEVHPERIEAIVLEQPADPAGQANP